MSISEAKVLFLTFWSVAMVDSNQQRNRVCACLETIKTHYLVRSLTNPRNIRFLWADRLYFNYDVFSRAMLPKCNPRITLDLRNLLAGLRRSQNFDILGLKIWLFYYFNFERSWHVLKLRCMSLNKNINFDNNET